MGATSAFVVASVLFTVLPEIDLLASRFLVARDGGFVGSHIEGLQILRKGFVYLFWGVVAVSVWGLVATAALGKSGWLRVSPRQWLYVLICLGIGPGLVANTLLKDQWGRARPREVAEFGGQRACTPALVPTNQCARNCSFVSGEASSAFVPFYAAALAIPQWRAVAGRGRHLCRAQRRRHPHGAGGPSS